MKIATWNVNSVRARIGHLTRWLQEFAPDIVMLQELKCQTAEFPLMEIQAAGYQAEVVGQKTYNGVAILSKHKIENPILALPGGDSDEQARYVEATVAGLRVASIYLPNGNPVRDGSAHTEKFKYKLSFFDRLARHARALLKSEQPAILAGDWNVCPTDQDVWDPVAMAKDALCQPESRAAFRKLVFQGWTDAIRTQHPDSRDYTYWDYFQNRFERDHGLRIDHLLLSPRVADRLVASGVDRTPRGWEKASDHTPAWVEIKD